MVRLGLVLALAAQSVDAVLVADVRVPRLSRPGIPAFVAIDPAAAKQAAELKNATGATQAVEVQAKDRANQVSSPGFLRRAADECKCKMEDICDCHAAMRFLNCVSRSCSSGKCDCHEFQFMTSCTTIATTCNSLDISCSRQRARCLYEDESEADPATSRSESTSVTKPASTTATTTSTALKTTSAGVMSTTNQSQVAAPPGVEHRPIADIYDELKDLKERRCILELATEDGWMNTEKQLPVIRRRIKVCMEELAAQQAQLPEMHCEKHFEEWHDPPTTTVALPSTTTTTATTTATEKSQAVHHSLAVSVVMAFCVVFMK